MTEHELFFQAVSVAAGSVSVAYPNIPYSGDDPYYTVSILPAGAIPIDLKTESYQSGICQVSCYIRDGIGEIKALEMAQTILNAFPRLTKLEGDGIAVHIKNPAWISPGISVDGWYFIPVSIPYHYFK